MLSAEKGSGFTSESVLEYSGLISLLPSTYLDKIMTVTPQYLPTLSEFTSTNPKERDKKCTVVIAITFASELLIPPTAERHPQDQLGSPSLLIVPTTPQSRRRRQPQPRPPAFQHH